MIRENHEVSKAYSSHETFHLKGAITNKNPFLHQYQWRYLNFTLCHHQCTNFISLNDVIAQIKSASVCDAIAINYRQADS